MKKFKEDYFETAHQLKVICSYALQSVIEYSGLNWSEATEQEKQDIYWAVTCIQDRRVDLELIEWLAQESMIDVSEEQNGSQYQFMFIETASFANELVKREHRPEEYYLKKISSNGMERV